MGFRSDVETDRPYVPDPEPKMTDAATAAAAKPKAAKPKKASKPKAPAAHPTYINMVSAAIGALKERNGSSRQALLKYIMANYKLGSDQKPVSSRLKVALRNGTAKGVLKHVGKSTGASGSFKLAEKAAAKPKKAKSPKKKTAKKPAAKKPAAKKAATPKEEPRQEGREEACGEEDPCQEGGEEAGGEEGSQQVVISRVQIRQTYYKC